MGLLGFYDALAKRFRKTGPSPLIVSEKREIRSIKAEFGPDIVRAQGDGLLIELDPKRLRKLITLGNWLVLFYDGGHLLLPRRIFPDATTAERYISYVRGLIRRRWRTVDPALIPLSTSTSDVAKIFSFYRRVRDGKHLPYPHFQFPRRTTCRFHST
ncbi:hypothetical protein [Neorhizobium galegae]|uniref:hypothetical protein n=1 Tax=Neorhizobium galegae TaxID=399 RepID=UPI00128AC5C2|nr:hypothetical protein [Neorhizobium galegae]KAA9385495.1 hypothetical protein F4V88_02995 [Neorhizobium galegae]MCM2499582.1 hypothetical protein [Neorhizobium galegae]